MTRRLQFRCIRTCGTAAIRRAQYVAGASGSREARVYQENIPRESLKERKKTDIACSFFILTYSIVLRCPKIKTVLFSYGVSLFYYSSAAALPTCVYTRLICCTRVHDELAYCEGSHETTEDSTRQRN